MGEFVIDHIMTVFRVPGFSFHGIPDEDHRATIMGFPEDGLRAIRRGRSHFKKAHFPLRRQDGCRININGFHPAVTIAWQREDQQARVGGNYDANFIRQFKAIAPQPMLFGNKDLDKVLQTLFFFMIEVLIIGNVFLSLKFNFADIKAGLGAMDN